MCSTCLSRPLNKVHTHRHTHIRYKSHMSVFRKNTGSGASASHLPHEGNSEQLFSRAGGLSDDNGKMDPARLAVWTSIGINYSTFKPTVKQILERYMLKFSKGATVIAQMHQDDLGLLDPEGGEGEGYLVQAAPVAEEA